MFGAAVCDIYNSIDVHASTVSTLHLCCISLDRYFAIVKPFDYHHFMNPRWVAPSRARPRSALAMILAAWMCPGLISFVPILLGWWVAMKYSMLAYELILFYVVIITKSAHTYLSLFRSGKSGIEANSGFCVFHPNVPYAMFSSFMTFWCPVTCMIIVYYRVYR
jgi:hypothetical protein